MARSAEAQFAGNVHAPAEARSFAAKALGSETSATQLGDIAMIVSELVTNAVRAGARVIRLEMSLDESELRIEVTDDVPGWPTLREAGEHDSDGRGLPLVAALAERWGVDPQEPTGKHVWATLHLAQAS